MKKKILPAVLSVFLLSCASGPHSHESYLHGRNVPLPSRDAFYHCHGYGCKIVSEIKLTDKDWQQIMRLFRPKAKNAETERAQIAKAVGLLERLVGPRDGTAHDVRGTFRDTGDDQLDCVDESTNTTAILALLQNENLLTFHTVQAPTVRLPIIHAGRWPHQTAVIRENKTGTLYAVDSWFQDNGHDADIIDLKTWKEGWKPESVRDFL